jgi:hypothetical protein
MIVMGLIRIILSFYFTGYLVGDGILLIFGIEALFTIYVWHKVGS